VLGALDTEFKITRETDNSGRITNTAQRDIDDDVEFQFTRTVAKLGEAKGRPVTSIQVEIKPASPTHHNSSIGGIKLTKNQGTMFAILSTAGAQGLTTEAWNDKARAPPASAQSVRPTGSTCGPHWWRRSSSAKREDAGS
jgi:hypothetical protein